MVTQGSISRLRRLRLQGYSVSFCAWKCCMDRKTASKYLDDAVALPAKSEARDYRTRQDPIAPFWTEIERLLDHDSRLKPYAIFEHMRELHPDTFPPKSRRTVERRVREWKIEHGVAKSVTFDQIHQMADVLAFDFTSMNELGVSIAGTRFDHLVFHSVLTYSNWEYMEVCLSESFEAVASGLQHSFMAIGGVTRRVRCDSLTAAVNNLSVDRQFQANYESLLNHFGVKGHRINVRAAHENGDCESSHGHFKDYVDQQLLLRGNRDFDSLDAWKAFLQNCIDRRNVSRQDNFRKEQAELEPLPNEEFPIYTQLELTVRSNSILRIKQNTYCVPSSLIGLSVHIRIYADTIEVWYAGKKHFVMPRLIGKSHVYFDFREVIDSLVRKPNAFANYRYREHMYPSITFRKAFDWLESILGEAQAIRVYLKALYAAKHESLNAVEELLSQVMSVNQPITRKELEAKLKNLNSARAERELTDVSIEPPALESYDDLIPEHTEVPNAREPFVHDAIEEATKPCRDGFPFETASSAGDAGVSPDTSRTSGQRELDALRILERTDEPRMPRTDGESNCSPSSEHARPTLQDVEPNQLESDPNSNSTAHGATAHRRIPQEDGQRFSIWSSRIREDDVASRIGLRTDSSGLLGVLFNVLAVSTTLAVSQTRTTSTAVVDEAESYISVDHRRSWVCSTESGGDGGTLHADRRSLRTLEYSAEQQPTILAMGDNLQGSDDDRSGDRSPGPSQHDLGAEHPEQTLRRSQRGTGAIRPPESTCLPIIQSIKSQNFGCGFLIVAKAEI
jgi:transposase